MGQYKLIKFFCEIWTDGDFSFKLIPPCMRIDFDKEHYKIEFSESPAYNETDEEFLDRIIKEFIFIKDTLKNKINDVKISKKLTKQNRPVLMPGTERIIFS